MQSQPLSMTDIASWMLDHVRDGETLIVGVTGSVAAGKSTFCRTLADSLSPRGADIIATDGFLLPNAVLTERDLMLKKGYPETFDAEGLIGAIEQARSGPIVAPQYSHTTYDIDPTLSRTIVPGDVLIFEGLGFSPLPDGRSIAPLVDMLIYIDANEADLEAWYTARFMDLWRQAEHDPSSFYARFRSMSEPETEAFARSVWERINLPNLRDHIVRARSTADVIVRKSADHAMWCGA